MTRVGGARPEFTLETYRYYLELALDCGYVFVDFQTLDVPSHAPRHEILLRHDIDYAPRYMSPLATLEANASIRATYCVQLDSPWYRLESDESERAILQVLEAGHVLGLHFDARTFESDADASKCASDSARRLGERFGVNVSVVSFHMPGRRRVDHLQLANGLTNTYAPRFFTEIGYVSDSNQQWRGVDLEQTLVTRRYQRFQLLIHPFWWRERSQSMSSKVHELARDLGVEVYDILTPEQLAVMTVQETGCGMIT